MRACPYRFTSRRVCECIRGLGLARASDGRLPFLKAQRQCLRMGLTRSHDWTAPRLRLTAMGRVRNISGGCRSGASRLCTRPCTKGQTSWCTFYWSGRVQMPATSRTRYAPLPRQQAAQRSTQWRRMSDLCRQWMFVVALACNRWGSNTSSGFKISHNLFAPLRLGNGVLVDLRLGELLESTCASEMGADHSTVPPHRTGGPR